MATNITITTGGTTTAVTIPEVQNTVEVTYGNITKAERDKLAGIETGATSDQSIITNDGLSGGASSGDVTLSVDNTVVRTTGNQSIAGTKTFTGSLSINGAYGFPTTIGSATQVLKVNSAQDGLEFGEASVVADLNDLSDVNADFNTGNLVGVNYLGQQVNWSMSRALVWDPVDNKVKLREDTPEYYVVSGTQGSPGPGQQFVSESIASLGGGASDGLHTANGVLSINQGSQIPNTLKLYVNGNARVNGAIQVGDTSGVTYAFPTTDGTANQLLATDGSGAVTFVTPTTSNVTEGTNLYYTDTRADARIAAANVTDLSDVTSAGSGAIITSAERTKLTGIATGATANDTDANLKNRANHTGTQTASTISDFNTQADARIAAASIDDLSDVDTSTVAPTDGQALVWDNTNSKWEPGTVSGGSSAWTTSGDDIYYTTGNVGIGTTSPSQPLHVDGNAKVDGQLIIQDGTFSHIVIGNGALPTSASPSYGGVIVGSSAARFGHRYQNVIIGQNAGYSGLSQSDKNVAVGGEALKNGQARSNNVAIGQEALEGTSSTTASNTVAVGYQALTALTTGTNNTAVGYQAGDAITTGGSHVIIGYTAGTNVTTAQNSVIIGSGAGASVTDGNRNNNVLIGVGSNSISNHCVAVGHDTYVTGQYSTAVGHGAGKQSSAGTNSTYIGFSAGRGVSGANNTTVGFRNMYFTSGAGNAVLGASTLDGGGSGNNDNVIIGFGAGHSGSGNVLIGRAAGSTASLSNKLYIENSNSTTPLIYGEFDNDIVRVNGTLQVNDPSSTGYSFPTATGTLGQVLEVDASGDLVFATPSGGGGGGLGSADQTLTADRTIDTNGYNLDIELDPTGTADTFTIHDGTHDLFQVDTGTTGTIFSVNDVSGLPKFTVDDSDGVTIDKFKEVKYEKPSNTDFSYQGDVVYFGATTGMTQGDLYYYNSSGNWAQADADAASSSGSVLLAIALGTASDTNGMLLKGTFTMAAGAIDGTEATGDELYVSTTAGHVTNTAPTATGDIVRVVGYMLDGTNGQIWFNPSNDFITLA